MLEVPKLRPEDSGGWQPVRDSWVDGDLHALELDVGPRGEPPPLPPSVREAPAARSPDDDAFAELMFERLAGSDWAGALAAAEALLRTRPTDADALDCAQMCRAELQQVYVARLGSLERVPYLVASAAEDLAALDLGERALAVLARVDGATPLGDIVRAGPHAPFEVLRLLSELRLRRLIALGDATLRQV